MVDKTPSAPASGLVEYLARVLAEGFQTFDAEIGAQFLGDWIVIAEVHTEEGAVLRIASSEDTPLWRQQMLATFAADDLRNDMLLYRLMSRDEGEDT